MAKTLRLLQILLDFMIIVTITTSRNPRLMLQISKTITARVVSPVPTCLFVEHDLILELLTLLQGAADAEDDALAGLQPVQELAGTALLHDLAPGEAGELAEAIGAVDNGKALGHLSVGQDEVAICRG